MLLLVAIAVAIGIALRTTRQRGYELLVTAPGRGTVILAAEVAPGDVFDLSYIHSVSNSRVTGRFRVTDGGGLQPVTTTFRSFGPGLPWSGGEKLERLDDGTMVVHHDEPARDELRIWVAPLTEDMLKLGALVVQLTTDVSQPFLIAISARRR